MTTARVFFRSSDQEFMTEWIHVSCDTTVPRTGSCDVVLSLSDFERRLGMPTPHAVRRQLRVDVLRSVVLVDGEQAATADEVLRATRMPRLCTQAVLALPVEWLMERGLVAHESHLPMIVSARGKKHLTVVKRLNLRTWEGEPRGAVQVLVTADADQDLVVVTLERTE